MKTWRIWLILAVVFILGALAGATASGMYVRHRIRRAMRDGHPPALGDMMLRRLGPRMTLTEEQQRLVREVMTRGQERLQAQHQRIRQERAEIFHQIASEVLPHLQPEQREEFKAVCERFMAGPPPGMERGRRDRPTSREGGWRENRRERPPFASPPEPPPNA